MKFAAFSIRRKIVVITMLISLAAVTVACAILAIYDVITFRRGLVREISIQADIIVANSVAALTFDDEHAATEVLASLANAVHTRRALLYIANGGLFAEYRRADAGTRPPAPVMTSTHWFALHPSRRQHHAHVWRNRPRTHDLSATHRPDARTDWRRKRAGNGKRILV